MRVFKPQKLSLLTRPFRQGDGCHLGIAVVAFVPFDQKPRLLSEMGLWKFLPEQLGAECMIDAGMPKSRSEFVVTGSAYVYGEPQPTCAVRVDFGSLQKTLYVFGDRFWRRGAPTSPVPFREMPITWERAFGSPEFSKNPLGLGIAPAEREGAAVQPLPNIEAPGRLITSPRDRPEPAGFGAYDFMWPQRFAKIGTYDQKWLKNGFPGFAADIDWSIFNLTAEDQQQAQPFVGDESFRMLNMHPAKDCVEGTLPRIQSRCFLTRSADPETLIDVPMRLTTVWLFPHAERAVLIFHGSQSIDEDDAADIAELLIAAENLGEPREVSHYRQALLDRRDPERGAIAALRDKDLLPAGCEEPTQEVQEHQALFESEGLMRKNMRNRAERENEAKRAEVAALGLDPDLYVPPLPVEPEVPPLEELPDYAEAKLREAEAQRVELDRKAEEMKAEALRLCEEAGMDPGETVNVSPGPPRFSADRELARLREMIRDAKAIGMTNPEMERMAFDPEYERQLREHEDSIREAYRAAAHHYDAPGRPADDPSILRQVVVTSLHEGKSLARADLTGADLSGLNLAGADFTEAFLEGVNLAGADLTETKFEAAVLAYANLEGALITATRFGRANLGAAKLVNVRGERSPDLRQTILAKADLTGADLSGADLEQADFMEAKFQNTVLREIRAPQVTFMKTDLRSTNFSEARLDKCVFLECDISGVDFSRAEMTSAAFVQTRGEATVFAHANLTNGRFVHEANFTRADFRGATVEDANFRGTILVEADFTGATMHRADLSSCDLTRATLYQARARHAQFVRADFTDANLVSIDLMNGSLQKALLFGADLRGSNLYQADCAEVASDTKTRLDGANQKKARVYPLRKS